MNTALVQNKLHVQWTELSSMSLQRVKHADPIISFFTAERSPVSLKQEREVKYEIKAQCQIDGKWAEFTTGRLTQKFGVKKPACKSKVSKSGNLGLFHLFALGTCDVWKLRGWGVAHEPLTVQGVVSGHLKQDTIRECRLVCMVSDMK